MNEGLQRALASAVRRMLRPLVRILLRNGVPHGAFAEYAKTVYVEVATQEFQVPGRRPSQSRVSMLTGLTRKEVSRLSLAGPRDQGELGERYNRSIRVITGWNRDPTFHDAEGRPGPLRFDGEDPTFTQLVRRFAADVPARAAFDELLRVGSIEQREDGHIEVTGRAYVPGGNEEEIVGMLGTDVSELIETLDHNMTHPPGETLFQRKVMYDDLLESYLPELRKLIREKGQSLLEELDRSMAQHDREVNPELPQGPGRTASIGIYYYEDKSEASEEELDG